MKRFLSILTSLIFLSFTLSCQTAYQSVHYSHSKNVPEPFISRRFNAEVLTYINEVRQHPQRFYHKHLKSYINTHSDRFTSHYTSSLRKTLLHQASLPPFKKSTYLQSIAKKQLYYLTHRLKGKRLQHNQGNISFSDRIKGKNLSSFAENLYRAKKAEPLELVMDLLIDQGISSLGHRKNILSKNYQIINIQTAKASNNYIVTVIDFGTKK